jgi:hypothetical protein
MMHAELDGLVCSGPYQGRHLTYALLDERAPKARVLSRDEALAELVRRYFRSHGPATLRDFNWWSGLPMSDARRGLEIAGGRAADVDGLTYWTVGPARPLRRVLARPRGAELSRVFLLPIYDEYTVAYRDRQMVAQGGWPTLRSPSGQVVTFQHTLVIDGQVAGTWKSAPGRAAATVDVTPTRRLTAAERAGVAEATERYRLFRSV